MRRALAVFVLLAFAALVVSIVVLTRVDEGTEHVAAPNDARAPTANTKLTGNDVAEFHVEEGRAERVDASKITSTPSASSDCIAPSLHGRVTSVREPSAVRSASVVCVPSALLDALRRDVARVLLDPRVVRVVPAADGSFRVCEMPADRYLVVAGGASRIAEPRYYEIAPDKSVEIELPLRPAFGFALRFVDTDGPLRAVPSRGFALPSCFVEQDPPNAMKTVHDVEPVLAAILAGMNAELATTEDVTLQLFTGDDPAPRGSTARWSAKAGGLRTAQGESIVRPVAEIGAVRAAFERPPGSARLDVRVVGGVPCPEGASAERSQRKLVLEPIGTEDRSPTVLLLRALRGDVETIEDLAPGRYRLSSTNLLAYGSLVPFDTQIELPDGGVATFEVDVRETGTIVLHPELTPGVAYEGTMSLTIRSADRNQRDGVTFDAPPYCLPDCRPGKHTIDAVARPTYRIAKAEAVVHAGETSGVVLVFEER